MSQYQIYQRNQLLVLKKLNVISFHNKLVNVQHNTNETR